MGVFVCGLTQAYGLKHVEGGLAELATLFAERNAQPPAAFQFTAKHDVFQRGQVAEHGIALEHDPTAFVWLRR